MAGTSNKFTIQQAIADLLPTPLEVLGKEDTERTFIRERARCKQQKPSLEDLVGKFGHVCSRLENTIRDALVLALVKVE